MNIKTLSAIARQFVLLRIKEEKESIIEYALSDESNTLRKNEIVSRIKCNQKAIDETIKAFTWTDYMKDMINALHAQYGRDYKAIAKAIYENDNDKNIAVYNLHTTFYDDDFTMVIC